MYERIMMLMKGSLKGALEQIEVFESGEWDGLAEEKFMGNLKLVECYIKALEQFYLDLCINPKYDS